MYELIEVKRNEIFTTSKIIAEGTNNQHESIIAIIQKYESDFSEFGRLRFSDLKSGNPKGGRPEKVYYLNEEQATLLITYLRNNEIVRKFKKNLVHQFYQMRRFLLERQSKAWVETREASKANRLKETDVIKLLTEYAKNQGSMHPDKLYVVYGLFVLKTRKVNNKPLSADINLGASDVGAIPASSKGAANGVAELDASGKVPAAQLPSYVDDVIEGYVSGDKLYKEAAHTTQITCESGKIYVDLATNKTYRWSGTALAEISASLAIGTTASTAGRGDWTKAAYDHSQAVHAPADAEKNVQSDWSVTDANSDAFIKNKPTSLPANGGNAATVNNHSVNADVPANAKFTDTTYAVFKGATASAAGGQGLVPAPAAGGQDKYLAGDGTFKDLPTDSAITIAEIDALFA